MTTDERGPVIAIVGAGFSGTMVACHLIRQQTVPLTVLLIEQTGEFGVGIAYKTNQNEHLLNVSAGAMSAWPEDGSHLVRWLRHNQETIKDHLEKEPDSSTFIPRMVYRAYIQSVLKESESVGSINNKLIRVSDELVDVENQDASNRINYEGEPPIRLHFRQREPAQVDHLVLAWGNSAIQPTVNAGKGRYHGWENESLEELKPKGDVVILGSGLTMVDVVVKLHQRGHKGKVTVISRHGLRPNSHQYVDSIGDWMSREETPNSLLALWRLVRRKVKEEAQKGVDWRAVIDGMRPRTQDLWKRLSDNDRKRFLRHVSTLWDVHRHRIAPEISAIIDEMITSGQLRIIAGRIVGYGAVGQSFQLRFRPRSSHEVSILEIESLIECTGIPLDYRRRSNNLASRMIDQDIIAADSLGLGILCNSHGGIVNSKGKANQRIHTIGATRKGHLWESIAVPELRVQASEIARCIIKTAPREWKSVRPVEITTAKEDNQRQLLIRQLIDSKTCTYTYLIADKESQNAVLIDPVLEQVDRDMELLSDLDLRLISCLETHLHADHITSAGLLRRRTGCRLLVPAVEGIHNADQLLQGGEVLQCGAIQIEVLATPGHTSQHVAYKIGNSFLFSGDSLLIRGCGRTDFQNGDPGTMYDSLMKILMLPDEVVVYPCHDYKGQSQSTIGEERKYNKKLKGQSREGFIVMMNQQRLAPPKAIDTAVPANLYLGDFQPDGISQQIHSSEAEIERDVNRNERENKQIYNEYFGMFI